MNDKEKKLKFEIVRNCEPNIYTPLWEVMSLIDNLFLNKLENEKIKIGYKAIIDLINKGFINIYLGSALSNEEYHLLTEMEVKNYIIKREYWYSDIAPEKYIELFLTPIGVDICIGKVPFDKVSW